MAISLEYVVKETSGNLWRNRLMSLAAILTISVSLALAGASLLLKQGVSTATSQWKGGVQLLIFMQPNATSSQTKAVSSQLNSLPEIKSYFYMDQSRSYQEFKQLMANSPDLLKSVTESQIPPSFRVVLKNPNDAPSVGSLFQQQIGVKDVNFNRGAINTMLHVTSIVQFVIVALAAVLLVSASVLILNVIRVAIFSRRREVAVMKLVGATNWFIRIPFMLEGMVQGLVGAIVAAAAVIGIQSLFEYVVSHFQVTVLSNFLVSSHDVFMTELFVVFMGIIVGTAGSAFAVRRYLEV
ncbi:MAG: permease-like cell division protein FtsX [Actinomycetota bacterium]|nr:permease-like cell division protein FtsX [Actinomycetota bacterium]